MKIKFKANIDGISCYQASLGMALEYLMPERQFTMHDLKEITQQKTKWTWPTASILWMIKQGLKPRLIEEFDFSEFSKRGKEYLRERYGDKVAEAQNLNSDLEHEQTLAEELAKEHVVEYRNPTVWDISAKTAAKEHVVIVNVNAGVLHGTNEYANHAVVVLNVSPDTVTLHDSGLPAAPYFEVPMHKFLDAWSWPNGLKSMLSIGWF